LIKRTVAIALAGLLLLLAVGFPPVHAQTATDTQALAKVRAKVRELGAGEKARVEVKLRDNTKLKGYIGSAGEDSFSVVDSKSGASQTVSYADVTDLKKQGGGLSTKTWIIIGAVAAGAIITLIAVKPALCDGGAQSRFPC
jgi:hypothetical protein